MAAWTGACWQTRMPAQPTADLVNLQYDGWRLLHDYKFAGHDFALDHYDVR